MADDRCQSFHRLRSLPNRRAGSAAVEFAMLSMLFFTLVFGLIELVRVMYMVNTLQEVTRRAAAMASYSAFDPGSQDAIRKAALFKDANGNLVLGDPITPDYVKLDYFSIAIDAGTGALRMEPVSTMPADPARNQVNCVADPHGANCIRLIQARICVPGGADCTPVPYKMLFPLIDLSTLKLPVSKTIVPAQTLGFTFGSVPGG